MTVQLYVQEFTMTLLRQDLINHGFIKFYRIRVEEFTVAIIFVINLKFQLVINITIIYRLACLLFYKIKLFLRLITLNSPLMNKPLRISAVYLFLVSLSTILKYNKTTRLERVVYI